MYSPPKPAKRTIKSNTKPVVGHVQEAKNMFNQRRESTENSRSKKSGGYQRTSTKPVVGTVNSLKSKFENNSWNTYTLKIISGFKQCMVGLWNEILDMIGFETLYALHNPISIWHSGHIGNIKK